MLNLLTRVIIVVVYIISWSLLMFHFSVATRFMILKDQITGRIVV